MSRIVRSISRWSIYRSTIIIITMILGAALILASGGKVLDSVRWKTGQHLTFAEAVAARVDLDVPSEAYDISYRQRLFPSRSTFVSFVVDEDVFLAWANAHGWDLSRIDGECITLTPTIETDTWRPAGSITDGYVFDNRRRGRSNTVFLIYNRKRRMAYYEFQSAPLSGED